jgi:hypothetical protein
MPLKNIGRQTILAAFILASVLYAGCSSGPSVKYASDQSELSATAAPTPVPTPNADQAAGLISRFYRDIDADTKDSEKDIASIVSADFLRNHHNDFITAYGFVSDPKVQVRSVSGRTVSYALDYVYLTKANGKLFWERTGRWALNHGAKSGWVLDNDVWDSVHLIGVSTQDHPAMIAVQDTVYGDGRHEFTYNGERLSFLAKGDSWHITAVAIPTPMPPVETADAGASSSSAAPETQQATTSYQAPPPPVASADCEEVGVSGVYDDGKVLALDDGRHLRVDDVDTVTSTLWVAPFDGLICEGGGRFTNKDDNETVDLAY